jgi:hypothetical protein
MRSCANHRKGNSFRQPLFDFFLDFDNILLRNNNNGSATLQYFSKFHFFGGNRGVGGGGANFFPPDVERSKVDVNSCPSSFRTRADDRLEGSAVTFPARGKKSPEAVRARCVSPAGVLPRGKLQSIQESALPTKSKIPFRPSNTRIPPSAPAGVFCPTKKEGKNLTLPASGQGVLFACRRILLSKFFRPSAEAGRGFPCRRKSSHWQLPDWSLALLSLRLT